MQIAKLYLKGLVPFVLIMLISNYDVAQQALRFQLSWWNVYLIVSYIVIFPAIYLVTRHHIENSRDFEGQLNQPRKNAEQEAMRLGSSYANTGMFGVTRIGDAQGKESWLVRWGIDFITRLFLLFCGVFVLAYRLWQDRR
ncbi:hypothetical protein ACN50C_05555 [Levilactobacillus brevis]|uniref:Uncharacterized protein n=5 Tax=Levilactobacillus brevis TaxID=1580 RepID=Q03TT7_LEVBA|nr:hypothetical protein [Levilactobacillus brevis]MBL3536058.1 hypothetical protein [Lactobacillus sp. GPR40-2]MBL3629154.1 hypothetical protein [Lactobacillus sp. GPB7-4]ABJ63385.1 hypothetical protein LVIS_0219 [Levilactobacillus brevis ATCC 367]ARQ93127.1 hypothetical protein A6F60_05195 [Levilactobacillus brevis]ARW21136.1 hypothetical protein S101174_00254 [Levilactobacillus brevis]